MIDVQEAIDRSLYEMVRLELVRQGYTPDFTIYPDTREGYTEYEEALKVIRNTKGFAIELFNISPPEDKGLIKAPRIVMMNEAFFQGSIGAGITPIYTQDGEDYNASYTDPTAYDIIYSFILRATKTLELRALRKILHKALPSKFYCPFIGTDQHFFCELTGASSRTGFKDGGLEDHYRYYISDIFLTETVLEKVAKAINSITINTEIADRLNIITINNP